MGIVKVNDPYKIAEEFQNVISTSVRTEILTDVQDLLIRAKNIMDTD